MRWSPNLAFGNDTYARNAKEAERITNADLMRSTAVVGSAEGKSASFFHLAVALPKSQIWNAVA